MNHYVLSATAAQHDLRNGTLSSVELVQSCLSRIEEREPDIRAWEYLELSERLLQQAARCDALQAAGIRDKPLLGIPVAVKDIFATVGMPTGWGTPIHTGQQLNNDAAAVERLKAAGAIIVGKTVTTEYAAARPGKTCNPHNLAHTPGGSSSGSVAAVADFMVPLAIGSQTIGSTLRPAAYCGIVGFKPSFGTISRYGMMPCSRQLDHVGLFARQVSDIPLLLNALKGRDARDPDCHGYLSGDRPDWALYPADSPKFALLRGPYWVDSDESAKAALLESAEKFLKAGATVIEIDLPPDFDHYFDDVKLIASVDMAANHGADGDRYPEQMSPALHQVIQQGRLTSAVTYASTLQRVVKYTQLLDRIFQEIDAILMPVTTSIAPNTLDDTGTPVFCALSSLCGLPAISLPVKKVDGLPLGIQLMGPHSYDLKLLAIAAWAEQVLEYASLPSLKP